jgi:hypothetical protein
MGFICYTCNTWWPFFRGKPVGENQGLVGENQGLVGENQGLVGENQAGR